MQPKYRNTLRGTFAGDQYDTSGRQRGSLIRAVGPIRAVNVTSGRQRGTLILFMGATGAINGTPMVDNVRSQQLESITS